MYRPLPEGLMIKKSSIQGHGLITTKFIEKGTNLGVSHLKINGMLVRTPLGGFVNHSDQPNCIKSKVLVTSLDNPEIKFDYTKYSLVSLRPIKAWEELTCKYTFYDIKDKAK